MQDVEAVLKTGQRPEIKVSTLASAALRKKKVWPSRDSRRKRLSRPDHARRCGTGGGAGRVARSNGARSSPVDSMRKVIARGISESMFTAPHIYFFTGISNGSPAELSTGNCSGIKAILSLKISVKI